MSAPAEPFTPSLPHRLLGSHFPRGEPSPQLPQGELVMKVIPMPADCNAHGDIFGGWVMAQVDLAGAVLPARLVRGRLATVAVNQFVFKQPVRVGDILSFLARIERVGRTSVTVAVEVFAERFSAQGQFVKVTQAQLIYVAIDAEGRPRPVELDCAAQPAPEAAPEAAPQTGPNASPNPQPT